MNQKTLVGIVEKEGHFTFKLKYVPVVDSKRNMNLLFLINIDELKEYLEKYIGPIDSEGNIQMKDNSELQLVRFTKPSKEKKNMLYENLIQQRDYDKSYGNFSQVDLGKYILLSLRHIAPPVIYIDSPLSYMVEGQANKFYEGEGINTTDCEDPSVLVYCVIKPITDEGDE